MCAHAFPMLWYTSILSRHHLQMRTVRTLMPLCSIQIGSAQLVAWYGIPQKDDFVILIILTIFTSEIWSMLEMWMLIPTVTGLPEAQGGRISPHANWTNLDLSWTINPDFSLWNKTSSSHKMDKVNWVLDGLWVWLFSCRHSITRPGNKSTANLSLASRIQQFASELHISLIWTSFETDSKVFVSSLCQMPLKPW